MIETFLAIALIFTLSGCGGIQQDEELYKYDRNIHKFVPLNKSSKTTGATGGSGGTISTGAKLTGASSGLYNDGYEALEENYYTADECKVLLSK